MKKVMWIVFLLLPRKGKWGWWLFSPTHRVEAAPSWGKKSLLSWLLPLPSPPSRSDSNAISS